MESTPLSKYLRGKQTPGNRKNEIVYPRSNELIAALLETDGGELWKRWLEEQS